MRLLPDYRMQAVLGSDGHGCWRLDRLCACGVHLARWPLLRDLGSPCAAPEARWTGQWMTAPGLSPRGAARRRTMKPLDLAAQPELSMMQRAAKRQRLVRFSLCFTQSWGCAVVAAPA